MFEAISTADILVYATFLSKTETLVRGLLGDDPDYPDDIVVNSFISGLTRFVRLEFTDNDYRLISQMSNTDEFKKFMIKRLQRYHKETPNGPENASIQREIPKLIKALRNTSFQLSIRDKYPMPYETSFGWIDEFMKDRGRGQYCLYIDGVPNQYPEKTLVGIQHEYIDSKENISIRMCDHIAGFISKMMRAIETEMSKTKNSTFDDIEYHPVLGAEWFDLNEEAYETYQYIAELLNRDGPRSAMTTSYHSSNLMLYLLLSYMSSFDGYEDYSSCTPEEHAFLYRVHVDEGLKDIQMKSLISELNDNERQELINEICSAYGISLDMYF